MTDREANELLKDAAIYADIRWIPHRERFSEVSYRYLMSIKNDYEKSKNMANEYIYKKDAMDAVEYASGNITWAERDDCKKRLEELPPADVVQVVHSRWVLGGYDDMYYVCEECGHKQSEYYHKPTANFCPNCGAKMDKKE